VSLANPPIKPDVLRSKIKRQLQESARILQHLSSHDTERLLAMAGVMQTCLIGGGTIFWCGNGGSAADSQHLAAELIGRLSPSLEREPLSSIALTTDTSILTAVANDYGFEEVFSRQIIALGHPGDVLVSLSTSGNSKNLIKAVNSASSKGMQSLALLGGDGGQLAPKVNLALIIPSFETTRIQEAHGVIGHILCALVEQNLGANRSEGLG